jgi:hypothetical protein
VKNILEEMIEKSGLHFLRNAEFTEMTKGRYFQKEKRDIGSAFKQFYVILGANIESPVHNHKGADMLETHLLLYGSGKLVIYDKEGEVQEELELCRGEFHRIFSTKSETPNHKYVAGPDGSILLAFEMH